MNHDVGELSSMLGLRNPGHADVYRMCLDLRQLQDQMVRLSRTLITDLERNIHHLTEFGRSSNSLGPLGSSAVDLNRDSAIMEGQRKAIVIVCHILGLNAKRLLQVTLNVDDNTVAQ